ncbi:hypothetical protein QQP08_020936 [Theobroma cacao]|nr:hypothetical protein QQP08_020936 [Theobroma cacao]
MEQFSRLEILSRLVGKEDKRCAMDSIKSCCPASQL